MSDVLSIYISRLSVTRRAVTRYIRTAIDSIIRSLSLIHRHQFHTRDVDCIQLLNETTVHSKISGQSTRSLTTYRVAHYQTILFF